MRRLTRSELASRVGPRPPSDAFWRRAIDRGAAALAVGADAVVGEGEEETDGPTEPLDTGDIVDVGDRAFVVVGAERTESGGRIYRIELVADRDEG
ncbi:hypothetical protein C465_15462 [Halorubrum distributum JCM 9100]|uniref:Uncharacterized protein n=4 Tax=Halorubrum distributum TaxID=29283 RepID=M0EB73_9EURY|nr:MULTISPECIES: hypothetical protein [Halorubrum distributum group]ELZ45031.1 hypothetical protein C465_15462 [Halorubrum distributum JCM 9100]ELZ51357.1 hypothetical protein C466_13727 [Halorubrum distributum JCM 10118]EMA70564.1 hypothetical protein C462_10285 [Halorubrum arcis JCM 13916]MDV7350623.1 hypothetical protein [Halorubrum distributum]MYL16477.1 hypothetical protein [Halorubrum terrestre]